MDIGEEARVRVLDLETLIVIKGPTGQPKRPRRAAHPPADTRREEKEAAGRLKSSSLSSLFDRGAGAKRVVSEIEGEFSGQLALNG
jgi:hypothetical protein